MRSPIPFVILAFLFASACQEPQEKPLYYSYDTFEQIEPQFNKQNDSVYVINFWATWCKPCVEEMPYFEQLHENLGDQKVKVMLVSMDFKKDVEDRFIPFLEERNLGPDVALLLDGKYNDWIAKVEEEWDGAIPATLIYKGDERIFHGKQFANYQQLASMVKSLL